MLNKEKLHVAPSPHMTLVSNTTSIVMLDVILALVPAIVVGVYLFGILAVKQLLICVLSSVLFEMIWQKVSKKPFSIGDLSAIVTGLILGLSLPATAPVYIGIIGSGVAIIIGKSVFGGLGMNIFNPAMVGRAFIMISFAGAMGAGGYVGENLDIITQATPLTARWDGSTTSLLSLFLGNTNGSIGEVSAVACIIGGIYLIIRKVINWEIPVSIIATVFSLSLLFNLFGFNSNWNALHQIFSGALLLGAFFIATDHATSPLSFKGNVIYGILIGVVVLVIRSFTNYPEGVMFAVLLGNGAVPLINRYCIPSPFGYKKPVDK